MLRQCPAILWTAAYFYLEPVKRDGGTYREVLCLFFMHRRQIEDNGRSEQREKRRRLVYQNCEAIVFGEDTHTLTHAEAFCERAVVTLICVSQESLIQSI